MEQQANQRMLQTRHLALPGLPAPAPRLARNRADRTVIQCVSVAPQTHRSLSVVFMGSMTPGCTVPALVASITFSPNPANTPRQHTNHRLPVTVPVVKNQSIMSKTAPSGSAAIHVWALVGVLLKLVQGTESTASVTPEPSGTCSLWEIIGSRSCWRILSYVVECKLCCW